MLGVAITLLNSTFDLDFRVFEVTQQWFERPLFVHRRASLPVGVGRGGVCGYCPGANASSAKSVASYWCRRQANRASEISSPISCDNGWNNVLRFGCSKSLHVTAINVSRRVFGFGAGCFCARTRPAADSCSTRQRAPSLRR
jgi:hypothetical protein